MKEKGEINKRALDFKGNDESIKKIKTSDDEKEYEKKNSNDAESKIDSSYSLYLECQKGRNKNLKDNLEYIELLKKNARRKYLKEREKEKLDITKKLLDDELLYSGIKLDEKDIKELEFSKKIYNISKENVKLREKMQESYYTYQEDIDEKYNNLIGNILQQNDNNADPSLYNYDQQIINKGIMKFGSESIQKNNFTTDFVFDNDIDYAKDTKKEIIEDKEKDKNRDKHKSKDKERDKKSEKKKYKEKHGEKYYNKHEMKSDKYKKYSSSDDSNSSNFEKISKSKKNKTEIEKEKKNIKRGESGDEKKLSEMKNSLNDAVEFVHLDSLSGMSEKEKELQKLFEDIQKNKEKKMKQIINERKRLPIYSYRYDILKAIKNNKILILVGETGSGKSTQLTQYLYECKYHLYGNIICTQPRRIACIAIANRVADEMNVKVGKEVGYVIRFQNKTSENTKVIYMTDGMFLRLLLYNPTLEGISVLIVDEAHERALHTDVILPIIKDICNFRENIRIVISSATLDAEKISSYFNCAPIFYVPGRKYNVDIYYTINNESNYLSAIVITILQIHITQGKGDILVFLPGQFEIELVQQELESKLNELAPKFRSMIILPIYSSLPAECQSRIFEDIGNEDDIQNENNDNDNKSDKSDDKKSIDNEYKKNNTAKDEENRLSTISNNNKKKSNNENVKLATNNIRRKIILSTNICETSITIDNIIYVIDSGLCKQKIYNPNSGIESLVTLPCSKASVNQRAGRAGRKQDGKCFRLFTKKSFIDLSDNSIPEIQRCEISSMILLLKSLGMDDIINFDFLDPPSPVVIIKGLELLYSLGALNNEGNLTKTGRKMAEFPTDVKSSKMILSASEKYNCVDEILSIISMLTHANSIFYVQKGKEKEADNVKKIFIIEGGGDFFMFLNIFKQCEENNFSTSYCYDHFLQYHTLIKIKDIKTQLISICEKLDLPITSCGIEKHDSISNIKKCIISGFFTNAALPINKTELKIIKLNQVVSIYPSSVLSKKNIMEEYHNSCIIFYEVIKINKSYIRYNIDVNKDLLFEIASFYFFTKN
ncbi:pre-mRNA-splicing factor ATP-dependent RNA helicase PRP2, putative [Plasmodium berghei]|uniref:RNA helicase n=2 Tax=Plasmodium berghei TaxID=5821 RepID=A0A509B144_PLABA|nr:pre-mRNA-splicing factor ATP-dependent RNA helicase PRP2, putative [Plasmodium berghei ANKA]CXJ24505.1 pre-mRNA-splicing factor ATP-dependent RNA helicase PRP2, putative [Plasmodium berghei]SCM26799.1 pre-mRNA-splicing factor ATP-dependent RNA helicase PRP2, putative [Plasmodium berghei]SCN28643.1 pre-mRNA-splicing factor ATP-dependent RNA helicase PRP2, putative [Plasmodium berghei]SCO62851.1 pre-mRNA-splicing factor ATP-dependent RNA helicase PRP2, putative [Plasmodium berghei]SCO64391.1 |eukprot:XP_034424287.1 pre-mRNA-splicing factor ATP-dependent RNA helicase PRP2, putative [Plasmodium berghei ANKA]